MRVGLLERLDDIPAKEWDALGDPRYPFLRSDFLAALERGGSVGKRSGWQPFFVTLTDDRGLAAAAPAWLKTHSYGEFVFDFAWAQAYARHGLAYYPKLVVAAPLYVQLRLRWSAACPRRMCCSPTRRTAASSPRARAG